MKRHSYRKSSVGMINPVFQGKDGNPFFRRQAEKKDPLIPSIENDSFFDPMLQREMEDKGEEAVQSAAEEEEAVQTKGEQEEAVQSAVEEEEAVQAKGEEESIQSAAEEEEAVQANAEEEAVQPAEKEEAVQAKEDNSGKAVKAQSRAYGIESTLFQEKGKGKPIEAGTRELMEKKFGADFSRVRIHTGQKAQMMSQKIQAKAFTHGYDIFFNKGQYQPETSQGKHLLAHELTHTLQQKGITQKQLQPQSTDGRPGLTDAHQSGKRGLKSHLPGGFTKNKD